MTGHATQPPPKAAAAGVRACMSPRKTTRAVTRNPRLPIARRLVSVSPGAERRQRSVELTERGREAFAATLPSWREASSRIVMSLDEVARGVVSGHTDRVAL